MRAMSKSAVRVAREALAVGRMALPPYASRYSQHTYTQPQLFALLALKQFPKTDYHGLVALLAEWSELRRALGLARVPHYSCLCRDGLGVRQTVLNLNPRNTGRRWPTTPYRREMCRRFPRAPYHQRWHAESAFSRHKRRLGSALTARRTASQQRETILRVLAHNLMILRRPRRISTRQHSFLARVHPKSCANRQDAP